MHSNQYCNFDLGKITKRQAAGSMILILIKQLTIFISLAGRDFKRGTCRVFIMPLVHLDFGLELETGLQESCRCARHVMSFNE